MNTSSEFSASIAIDHVEVFVPDRHEAAGWYRRLLGLEVMTRFESWAQDSDGPLMIGVDGGSMLALFERPPQGKLKPVGIRRVAFRTDGPGFCRFLDRLDEQRLTASNGRPVTRADVVDHDLAFSMYSQDPYGTRCELTTYDHAQVIATLAK